VCSPGQQAGVSLSIRRTSTHLPPGGAGAVGIDRAAAAIPNEIEVRPPASPNPLDNPPRTEGSRNLYCHPGGLLHFWKCNGVTLRE
jgi:hypothetical protein